MRATTGNAGTPAEYTEAQEFIPLPADRQDWMTWASGLPASRALGLVSVTIEPGAVRMKLDRSVWPLNPNGSIHGGLVLGVADHVMGIAAMTVTEPGQICATVSLTGNFHLPARLPLLFEAVVDSRRRTMAFVTLTITDADGQPCNRCVGTWSINRLPSGAA
jgi:acyl-coenzyme A thioesterase PaaI-like protein